MPLTSQSYDNDKDEGMPVGGGEIAMEFIDASQKCSMSKTYTV